MKKHFMSYGDSKYTKQKEFIVETAHLSGFFDTITMFSPDDLSDEFKHRIFRYVQGSRGGGYWVWKPYLIKQVIDQIPEGDILIYADAGCMINGKAKKRFDEYIDILQSSPTGTLDFELPFPEYKYTKEEVFKSLDSSNEIINSNQLMATVILLRKGVHSLNLITKWVEVLMEDFSLFTDEKVLSQRLGFIDHRHDQSIFSVIRKTYGANIIPDETYYLDFVKEGQHSPIWATRFKG